MLLLAMHEETVTLQCKSYSPKIAMENNYAASELLELGGESLPSLTPLT
jgi:hypothetical protein